MRAREFVGYLVAVAALVALAFTMAFRETPSPVTTVKTVALPLSRSMSADEVYRAFGSLVFVGQEMVNDLQCSRYGPVPVNGTEPARWVIDFCVDTQ